MSLTFFVSCSFLRLLGRQEFWLELPRSYIFSIVLFLVLLISSPEAPVRAELPPCWQVGPNDLYNSFLMWHKPAQHSLLLLLSMCWSYVCLRVPIRVSKTHGHIFHFQFTALLRKPAEASRDTRSSLVYSFRSERIFLDHLIRRMVTNPAARPGVDSISVFAFLLLHFSVMAWAGEQGSRPYLLIFSPERATFAPLWFLFLLSLACRCLIVTLPPPICMVQLTCFPWKFWEGIARR